MANSALLWDPLHMVLEYLLGCTLAFIFPSDLLLACLHLLPKILLSSCDSV